MSLLAGARTGFALACAGLAALIGVMAVVPGGRAAAGAIAGIGVSEPGPAIRLAAACDVLLPIGYASGFVLLAAGLARGPRGWVAAGIVGVLTTVGLTLDLMENAAALAGDASGLTPAKYGTLGAAAFVLSTLLGDGRAARLTRPTAQIAAPVLLAATIALPPDLSEPWLTVPVLLALFALLTLVAHESLSDERARRA
ncbi:hypothetical protein JQC91_04075 [Jannaschia sp. Os4]|uniref:hypothetical protein n=1 Tax=Jannaschia sp. Os4 TaxID=2807617 RepID=UPI00193AB61C|nr:hypothetical protein [Jannaschia sp. Os4]MBM2575472.1 hypothetical protein [Jannaschia sp. Os4]